jgi:hypothetical protein
VLGRNWWGVRGRCSVKDRCEFANVEYATCNLCI